MARVKSVNQLATVNIWGREEVKLLPDDTCEQHDSRQKLTVRELQPDGFKQVIQLSGAYKCSKTGGSSHGIGSMRMWFVLVGDKGAVQWMINTGWYTRSTQPLPTDEPHPQAWDLGYHSRKPRYEEQTGVDNCEFLDGAACYYDGSSLNAIKFTPDFITHPGEVWAMLRKYYDSTFGAN